MDHICKWIEEKNQHFLRQAAHNVMNVLGTYFPWFSYDKFHLFHIFFSRSDGTFTVNGVPPGSYVVEIANPTYIFESARVDITTKGKKRARKVNNVQSNAVTQMPYPLKFKTKVKASYFEKREQFRVTDMLRNPMVSWSIVTDLLRVLHTFIGCGFESVS